MSVLIYDVLRRASTEESEKLSRGLGIEWCSYVISLMKTFGLFL